MPCRYKRLWIIVILAALLVAVRAAVPYVVKDYVNGRLRALEAYDGQVDDIDLALWRGGYGIDGIRIVKTGAEQSTPFFSAERIDFSIEWRSLVRGSLVAQGTFWRPDLNLVRAPDERRSQLGKEESWDDRLEELFPFRFNTVRVREGIVSFRAPGIRADDALVARRVHGEISNLTNVVGSHKETFAKFRLTAGVLEGGSAEVSGSLDPNEAQPTFDVNLSVKDLEMPKVNPWLRQYIKASAESGDFELYLEIAAAEGAFKGYAKPIMHNVDIYRSEGDESSLLRRLWEGLVDLAAEVLENQEQEQVAARIPLSGRIEDPDSGIAETIVSVLRNAFLGAFARTLEGSISLRDVTKNGEEGGGTAGTSDSEGSERRRLDEDDK